MALKTDYSGTDVAGNVLDPGHIFIEDEGPAISGTTAKEAQQQFGGAPRVSSTAPVDTRTSASQGNVKRVAEGLGDARQLQDQPQQGSVQRAATTGPAQSANINQARTDTALGQAARGLQYSEQSRMGQDAQIEELRRQQAGQGPSIAAEQARRGGERAQELMRMAGAQSSQQFGTTAAQAGGAYGQAALSQQAATRQAGIDASNRLMGDTGAALRAQASLAAGARGGNMGGALLNAQNQQAATTQGALRQSAQVQDAANRQAGDNAARAQLQASQAQTMANLQTGGALERANLGAATAGADAMSQAAQLRAQEQLSATAALNQQLGQQRGQDLGYAQAGTGIAGVASGADVNAGQVSQFNAGQANQMSQFNAGQQQQVNLANMSNEQFNRQLGGNLGLQYTQAGIGMDQYGMGLEQGQAQFNAGQAQQVNLQQANLASGGMDRAADVYTSRQGSADAAAMAAYKADKDAQGGILGAVGGLVGGIISDRTAKKHLRPADRAAARMIASFRKARNYEYEYDDDHKSKPGGGRGKFTGPMAQDLPSGTTRKRRDGKLEVDPGRVVMLMAGALGDQQRRLDKLERSRD